MTRQQTKDALQEVRIEITRINAAANETIFNPAATMMLDDVLGQFEAKQSIRTYRESAP